MSRAPVLIANRGEIAIRIARTCRALGFPSVAIFSDADRYSEHNRFCDQAIGIGGKTPQESYLNIEKVIAAAKKSGAKFLHPGYGFLSERPLAVEACEKAGIKFVGPSASSMKLMGDKIQARATVDQLKIPRVPGSAGALKSAEEAKAIATQIGYPILLKASAGGGGKGMRRVDGEKDLASAFEGASREALSAFGDGSMYLEKLILEPHHVEIQVFGDGLGRAIHLGERECSIQRRHQKVLEESPAPILNLHPETREKMFAAAVRIAENVNYAGAGTLEFIVDGKGNFYFLEMNTRLQVEHPVTEWVTGVDLVAWQLQLAEGSLKLPAQAPVRHGSAIEVRLYAEDPQRFLPAPGPLGLIQLPQGAFVRADSAFTAAGEISVYYDPMIAKISTWGNSREEALNRLRVALDETRVEPPRKIDGSPVGSLQTNLSFLKRLVRNQATISGNTTTDLIGNHPDLTAVASDKPSVEAAIATALFQILGDQRAESESPESGESLWSQQARREGIRS